MRQDVQPAIQTKQDAIRVRFGFIRKRERGVLRSRSGASSPRIQISEVPSRRIRRRFHVTTTQRYQIRYQGSGEARQMTLPQYFSDRYERTINRYHPIFLGVEPMAERRRRKRKKSRRSSAPLRGCVRNCPHYAKHAENGIRKVLSNPYGTHFGDIMRKKAVKSV